MRGGSDRARLGYVDGHCGRFCSRARWLSAAFCALVGVLLLWCAPTLALSQRGHVFGSQFGGPGSGAGAFAEPAGVAVSEATHDVYVVDRPNSRVEQFGPGGQFIAAWGWGVSDGKKEFEVCTSGCQAG